jgi:hypothetical protein
MKGKVVRASHMQALTHRLPGWETAALHSPSSIAALGDSPSSASSADDDDEDDDAASAALE